MTATTPTALPHNMAFIGGGNMASAIIGGLLAAGMQPEQIQVVEPWAESRTALQTRYGITAQASASPALQQAQVVVWAVKPQTLREAAEQTRLHTPDALHLSVAAGIRTDSLARWLGSERIVRTMPNTPALVGLGMTGLFARAAVTPPERALATAILASTGQCLWVDDEAQLDVVTALSGSGPAYVFYFLEAMARAGTDMGLTPAQAHQLAVGTFVGAATLAQRSEDPPAVLRERVTSKGGTTYAALTSMEHDQVATHFECAMHAARHRAQVLGDEFGAD